MTEYRRRLSRSRGGRVRRRIVFTYLSAVLIKKGGSIMEERKDLAELPRCARNPYREEHVEQILTAAESYRMNADRLIYSGGGRTFLSGFEIHDEMNGERGNIDCSTFLLLVMAGVPYEKSPYATGEKESLATAPAPWADPLLTDFSRLPDRYAGIAEIIGRPDLVGDDGVDLEKARASGIDWTAVHQELAKNGMIRRAHQMARYYWERGECFSDAGCIMPGDLVFYQATPKWEEGYRFFGIFKEIAHVGIVSKDTSLMYNSSGFINKNRNMEENRPAVSLDPVSAARMPAFYARPAYGCSDIVI